MASQEQPPCDPGQGAPGDSAGAEPLPARNLPEGRWNFGTEHRYDPPIELIPDAPLRAGDPVAFRAMLPEPPNGDSRDEAFFYRMPDGKIVGYFNRCTHVTIPMDFDDGRFLDSMGFIMCRVHGARYELESGLRCFGPARANLTRVICEEHGVVLKILGWEKVR
jgi:nitrite reductase/ring-hydroxylating ferredoxin subunit